MADQSALKDVIGNADFQAMHSRRQVFLSLSWTETRSRPDGDIPKSTGGLSPVISLVPKKEIPNFAPRRILEPEVQSQQTESNSMIHFAIT